MSLRNILNPTEEANRPKAPRPVACRQAQRDQHDTASWRPTPDGPSNSRVPEVRSAATEGDDIDIGGHTERHKLSHTSAARTTNNPSSGSLTRTPSDRPLGMQRDAEAPETPQEHQETAKRGPFNSKTSSHETTTASALITDSNDESDDEDAMSVDSVEGEPSQRSTWSSLPGQQESSQSTVCSSHHEDVLKQHGSPMEGVTESCERLSTRGAEKELISGDPEGSGHNPRIKKRRRDSSSPELEYEAEADRRKIRKSSQLRPEVTHYNDNQAKRREYRSTDISPIRTTTIPKPIKPLSHAPPPLLLLPSRSNIYLRRQSTSPTRLPHLTSPSRRNESLSRPPTPQAPSPEPHLPTFNIFTALLNDPDLLLEFSKHLDISSLVSLYSISKTYHHTVNTRFTALILAQAHAKAPESASIFPFRAYRNLCRRDPAGRLLLFSASSKPAGGGSSKKPGSTHEAEEGGGKNQIDRPATDKDQEIRFVPSIRWLKMLLHRESVVARIIHLLAAEGHRLPRRTTVVLKKLWFTLDIADNGRRIGLLHDTKFWATKDLFLITMFFVKLDMRLTDPVTGTGELGFRRLLLAQRGGLDVLCRVLAREECLSQLELVRMWVRFEYEPTRQLREGQTVFGVPARELGKGCLEGWGVGDKKFVPVDELVMREAVRRGLGFGGAFVNMMLYGYINKKTWEDIRTVPEGGDARDSVFREEEQEGDVEMEGSDEVGEERKRELGFFWGESDEDEDEDDDEGEGGSELDFTETGLGL